VWADWLHKTNKEIGRLNKRELGYKEFRKGIDEYDIQEERQATGSGYSNAKSYDFHTNGFNSTVTCPGNILSDISRLEELIGEKEPETTQSK